MLIRAESLSKIYGHKEVIGSASLIIEEGDSIGLVGDNGAGKTTLIRMLMGYVKPDSGDIRIRTDRIGYLPQIPDFAPASKVKDIIEAPYGRTSNVTRRISELEDMMSYPDADWEAINAEYGKLQEEYASDRAKYSTTYTAEALEKLEMPLNLLERRMSELSGGEVTKVMLARILVQSKDVDVLFLDEPTSHLDVGTIEWLEDMLIDFPGAIVTISHDRYFLDRVATRIVEVRSGLTRSYNGSFTEYTMAREMEEGQRTKDAQKNLAERQRQERIIAEQKRRWGYMTTFKTRKRLLDKTAVKEAPVRDKKMDFSIRTTPRGGVNVIMARDMVIERNGTPVIRLGELDLDAGERLGIFGPNGSGKSTFIKALMGELPHKGKFWLAPGATIGYFAQAHDGLDPELSPEEQLMRATGPDGKAIARKTLSSFLITGTDAERRISTLSGGERARVALANLMVSGRNLLVLDEPTNYLDIRSRDAVEKGLSNYTGTIILVSHDRYLLDGICTRTAVLNDGEMKVFPGNYSEVKGRIDLMTLDDRIDRYEVASKFVDWSTRTKYKAGDVVEVKAQDKEKFKQWIERGFLRNIK
ncbi:MAG: ABC-F family ATP-binding cassette domain-containing protein [Candidatus Thermoplasmatota archaeon]|nr:ABC-F family ATP-binding cassette domain-containing protein [Candidatus Thermoplasmatota archaeon]